MKKFIAILLALVMLLALTACGRTSNASATEASEPTVSPEPTPIPNPSELFLNTPILEDAPYASESDQPGTIVSLSYETRAYALEELYPDAGEIVVEKEMNVYLPYGYSEEQQYNVFLLLHGSGQNEDYWFAQDDFTEQKDSTVTYGRIGNITQNILDNLIRDGTIEPMIVVTATYYASHDAEVNYGTAEYPGCIGEGDAEQKADYAGSFWKEIRQSILPVICENFSTYAEGSTEENIVAARDHFAYAGLSLGSKTGFASAFLNCADCFSYIGNYSAGTSEEIYNAIIADFSAGGRYADYKMHYWYNGCGEWDTLIKGQKETYQAITSALPEMFTEGDDIAAGDNCWFNVHLEGGHEYWCWVADFYNSLQVFFKA